ncbi:ser/Thr protein phosphatase family protein [Pleomassaria siparia CBS 279.74]|uniref:Ser/Thr protein phosphatase family protein n=1 Tax=Pleomassaria siparia CBS 279.74 TaxID=1314801 RepID=A0A6G1K6G3_9PLEO|nr:ser/Thr protein phosphatase family protein [Pleomassaria siparia CBS 279.74]
MSTTTTTTTSPSDEPTRIKTRFLILSDTHNASPYPPDTSNVGFRSPLPKADVLLHCGDLTMVGHLHEYQMALDMLASIDADLKLVIAGNHDISLDDEFYERRGRYMHRLREQDQSICREAREMWTGEEARRAGVTYLDEGTHTFTLKNGARLRVYASPYQPEFCDWAFPYFAHQDRFNPPHQATPNSVPICENPIPDFPAIDVVMTHGPPKGIRDETHRDEHVGCEHLLRAVRRCRPKLHCFGHIHEAWGATRVRWKDSEEEVGWEGYVEEAEWINVDEEDLVEDGMVSMNISQKGTRGLEIGKETLMVNASIMTHRYKPHQGPWIVDLDLDMNR